jgi:hypothetical protein
MNESLVNSISAILTQARDEIRANMQAQNVNASGRTSAALQVVQRGTKIELIKAEGQNAPFQTLQYGRGGGKVPAGFYSIIKQWTLDKGLSFDSETERGTFAYFVARKIAREGTQRHKTPNEKVYSEPIQKASDDVERVVRDYVFKSISVAINTNF